LLARHGTRGQAAFFLQTRGQRIELIEQQHEQLLAVRAVALAAIPAKWRRVELTRDELDRFLFEPDDIVVTIGQDGLVANVAKYLTDGQPVIGINPDPTVVEGALARHAVSATADLFADVAAGRASFEARTMVEARLDDDQRLLALNEIFVGHSSHQSARYELRLGDRAERHSSSGLIVATGTGQTGWARSLRLERSSAIPVPAPTDRVLTLFVREAWPSPGTGASLTEGLVERSPVEVVSRMEEGGVIFGDGVERDRLDLPWGGRAALGVASEQLHLVA
jgi:hypothetical protein